MRPWVLAIICGSFFLNLGCSIALRNGDQAALGNFDENSDTLENESWVSVDGGEKRPLNGDVVCEYYDWDDGTFDLTISAETELRNSATFETLVIDLFESFDLPEFNRTGRFVHEMDWNDDEVFAVLIINGQRMGYLSNHSSACHLEVTRVGLTEVQVGLSCTNFLGKTDTASYSYGHSLKAEVSCVLEENNDSDI